MARAAISPGSPAGRRTIRCASRTAEAAAGVSRARPLAECATMTRTAAAAADPQLASRPVTAPAGLPVSTAPAATVAAKPTAEITPARPRVSSIAAGSMPWRRSRRTVVAAARPDPAIGRPTAIALLA